MKKIQIYWAFLSGLISIGAQISMFYIRFGKWAVSSSILDYFIFFLAGSIGGLILIYFLNRQKSKAAWFATFLAFLLASPIAMIMMVGGGLLGSIGVIFFPQIPWMLFTWIGTLVGNFLVKK